jgi:hypothetical protein
MLSFFQRFVSLPAPLRTGIALVGLGGCGALAYVSFHLKGLIMAAIALVVVAIMLALYYAIIRIIKQRKAAAFRRQM